MHPALFPDKPIIIVNTAPSANVHGLTDDEVARSRQQHGSNQLLSTEDRTFFHVVKDVALEPMFILLLAACAVYFFMHQYDEGFIMLVAIFIVAGISFFQDYRSRSAVQALKKISAPNAKVIRNGKQVSIATDDIVTGDILLLEEGESIAADGNIISANDFSVNEAVITGESFPVFKNEPDELVFRGTLAASGSAIVKVVAVGNKTEFGKIGLALKEIAPAKTPLQIQIHKFVRNMVWFGAIAFIIVFVINYYHSKNFMFGLLQALTLAMSALPEEIPVAFSTFQALGAFRLLKNNIIVKQPQFVETLGSATVICIDKTGTITQNKMNIEWVYDASLKQTIAYNKITSLSIELIEYAMWSSETNPFDPMEQAIYTLYDKISTVNKRNQFTQVHEYPISGKPPMMTHIFTDKNNTVIIACKGAPEGILRQSNLSEKEIMQIEEQSLSFAKQGYRVLGVGKSTWTKPYPASQEEFTFDFLGLIAFNDPPKENIKSTIEAFRNAGIVTKIITGDYPETAVAIAKQIDLNHSYDFLTGKDIMQYPKEELKRQVKKINIFARVYPEAKLKIVEALKNSGEVVAMTGDGVNDTPALKAAHIGIAMGKRGSDAAKSTASLIITDDDLGHMTNAIALGRKIYDNLKKAIQYIVSIHIPIILIVTLPLLLAWKYSNLFSPVHVIFLELIMGPTCSIIYENEPIEPGTMRRRPRQLFNTFLSTKQLSISVTQGLMIAAGCLGMGYYFMQHQYTESMVRTVVFTTLLFSNIFLMLVNRSFQYTLFTTIRYKNSLVILITIIILLFIAAILYIPFIRELFRLEILSLTNLFICIAVALVCTIWIEFFKNKFTSTNIQQS